jgi:hypothetical protein
VIKLKKQICKENSYNGKETNLNKKKIDGFEIKPKNNLNNESLKVNSMTIVNQTYIEKILRRKTKRKLDYFLKYIISLIESSDEDNNPDTLSLALDDLEHYKSIVEYKYRKFLDEKYVNLLLQKISMLEHEIQVKLVSCINSKKISKVVKDEELEETKGKKR